MGSRSNLGTAASNPMANRSNPMVSNQITHHHHHLRHPMVSNRMASSPTASKCSMARR